MTESIFLWKDWSLIELKTIYIPPKGDNNYIVFIVHLWEFSVRCPCCSIDFPCMDHLHAGKRTKAWVNPSLQKILAKDFSLGRNNSGPLYPIGQTWWWYCRFPMKLSFSSFIIKFRGNQTSWTFLISEIPKIVEIHNGF